MTSTHLPPPTRLQRWVVRRRRAIRTLCAVYIVVVLLILGLAVAHGQAGSVTWVTTFGSVLAMVGVFAVLLPSVQQYVDRWDGSHEGELS